MTKWIGAVFIAACAVVAVRVGNAAECHVAVKPAGFYQYVIETKPHEAWKTGSYDIEKYSLFFEDDIDRNAGGVPDQTRPLSQVLYVKSGGRIIAKVEGDRLKKNNLTDGTAVTGGPNPTITFVDWSGGAHCCFTTYIFELGAELVVIAPLDTGDFYPSFYQADDDPALEVSIVDATYAYWRTSFVSSAYGHVTLDYDPAQTKFVYSTDLNRAKAPPMAAMRRAGLKIANLPRWRDENWAIDKRVPPELWAYMLALIYGGNFQFAELFMNSAWWPSLLGKRDFYHELVRCKLRESPYWPGIAALNAVPAKKPEKDCPTGG